MSAEKCKRARVGGEGRLNRRVNCTIRPAVLLRVEESNHSGVQIQFALRQAMVYEICQRADKVFKTGLRNISLIS